MEALVPMIGAPLDGERSTSLSDFSVGSGYDMDDVRTLDCTGGNISKTPCYDTKKNISKKIDGGIPEFPGSLGPYMMIPTKLASYNGFFTMLDPKLESNNPFYVIYRSSFSSLNNPIFNKFETSIQNFPLCGQMSPKYKITLGVKAMKAAKIPKTAWYYAWNYPLDLVCVKKKEHFIQHINKVCPEAMFLLVGGFIYFDKHYNVVACNTIQPQSYKLDGLKFGRPKSFPTKFIAHLSRFDRWKSVRVKKHLRAGAKWYAWIKPNEQLVTVDRTRRQFGPHGGFAYLFHDDLTRWTKSEESRNCYFPVICNNTDHCPEFALFLDQIEPEGQMKNYSPRTQLDAPRMKQSFSIVADEWKEDYDHNPTDTVFKKMSLSKRITEESTILGISQEPTRYFSRCTSIASTTMSQATTTKSICSISAPEAVADGTTPTLNLRSPSQENIPMLKQAEKKRQGPQKNLNNSFTPNNNNPIPAWLTKLRSDNLEDFELLISILRQCESKGFTKTKTLAKVVAVMDDITQGEGEEALQLYKAGTLTKWMNNGIKRGDQKPWPAITATSNYTSTVTSAPVETSTNTVNEELEFDLQMEIDMGEPLASIHDEFWKALVGENVEGYDRVTHWTLRVLNQLLQIAAYHDHLRWDDRNEVEFIVDKNLIRKYIAVIDPQLATKIKLLEIIKNHYKDPDPRIHGNIYMANSTAILISSFAEFKIPLIKEERKQLVWCYNVLLNQNQDLMRTLVQAKFGKNKDKCWIAKMAVQLTCREQIIEERLKTWEYRLRKSEQLQAELEGLTKEKHWMQEIKKPERTMLVKRLTRLHYDREAVAIYETVAKLIISFIHPQSPIPAERTAVECEISVGETVEALHLQKWHVGKVIEDRELADAREYIVEMQDHGGEVKPGQLPVPTRCFVIMCRPAHIRLLFGWECWRCGNKDAEFWRDVYPEKNWVCCIRCGIITEKTGSINRYIKRHAVRVTNFGKIFFGYDSLKGVDVAIKENIKQFVETGVRVDNGRAVAEDIEMEIKIHRAISSRLNPTAGILLFYDQWRDSQSIYMVLEWATHGELFEFVVTKFANGMQWFFKDRNARNWLVQMMCFFWDMVQGMNFCHERGIIHRDLSLENVLVVQGNGGFQAKICDFGLTKTYKEGERDTSCVGKFGYMSPECYKRDYDPKKNDVYCMGIMLFMMLVGAPPYAKLGDRAFRHLMNGKRHLMFLLRQYKRLFLVPESLMEMLSQIFVHEEDRISLSDIVDHDIWESENLTKYINAVEGRRRNMSDVVSSL